MNYRDRTVSKAFRDALGGTFPALGDNAAYWRMTSHLLFGTRRDIDTGLLMIPAELLASIEDSTPGPNYSAMKFLDAYRADVLEFEIEEYVLHPQADLCKCRAVKSITLPPTVEALVAAERRRHHKDDQRVWMADGKVWLRKHVSALRRAEKNEAEALAQEGGVNENTLHLIDYMNSLPPHRFTSALRHLPEAMAAAEHVLDADNQLNLLRAIRDRSQPFYKPVARSPRAYALGESVLGLHRNLRKIMTQDWITADLKSAQLAVVAQVWGIPSLNEYLRSGASIWKDLTAWMGLPYDDDNKGVMKKALYALIFGAGHAKMRLIISMRFGEGEVARAYRKFRLQPVIKSLLYARRRMLKNISNAQGMEDAWGNWIGLSYDTGKGYDNRLSILACVAQSYEMRLMMPVVQMALAEQFHSHGFTIMTWLHDGITFDVHHAEDVQDWKGRLALAVREQADRLGICTGLEFD